MTPLEPTTRLAIELEAQEWNMVLGALGELQRAAATLIGRISQQAQAASQRRGNGLDEAQASEGERVGSI